MRTSSITFGLVTVILTSAARAHSWKAGDVDREAMRAHLLADWQQTRALNSTGEIKPCALHPPPRR